MPTETHTLMEFHLDRNLPKAAGFALSLPGVALLFFSIAFNDEGAPALLGIVGLALLLISVMCFTLKIIVKMDQRTGEISKSTSTCFWNKTQCYSIADFKGIGIGMGGQNYIKTSARYCVQLLGPKNLNLPGMSNDKSAIISLAEQVGDYLGLPVDKKPKMAFFNWRL